jgi:hypothetical protein
MTREPDRRSHEAISGSDQGVPASFRRVWTTPRVIIGEIEDVEHGGGVPTDGTNPS